MSSLVLEYVNAARVDGVAQAKLHWVEGSDQIYECLVGIAVARNITDIDELDSIVDIVSLQDEHPRVRDCIPDDLEIFHTHSGTCTW